MTETIEKSFGRRPIVYRAGRYGVGPNSAGLLRDAGYKIDVSVRALYDYSAEGGPDFTRVRPIPYRIGDGDLVEVPLTAAYVGVLRGWGNGLFRVTGRLPHLRGVLARTRLLSRVALTPEGMPLREARESVERLIDDGVRLFSISFHSPSLEPGHTPYVRSDADLENFYGWWDGMMDFFARRGIAPASIGQVLEAVAGARSRCR